MNIFWRQVWDKNSIIRLLSLNRSILVAMDVVVVGSCMTDLIRLFFLLIVVCIML